MKLSVLIEELSDIKTENFYEQEISDISVNSNNVISGSIFVAIVGSVYDGHNFIYDAYRRGARTFVITEYVSLPGDSVIIYSKNTRKTVAELCSKMCGNPEREIVFVGVTGTKGKTTTSYILSELLRFRGIENILVGTLGVSGVVKIETLNTTPDPTVLFRLLSDALAKDIRVAVLEVSSQALKDFRVYGITFDYLIFTGLSKDHIDEKEHPTRADYISSKRLLFTSYGARIAVVNYDDPYSAYMSSGIPRVIKCGFSKGAQYEIKEFFDSKDGSVYMLSDRLVRSSLAGAYNARNTALALAVAYEMTGADISELSAPLEKLAVPGRFEVYQVEGRNVIIDYAHNYESLREVISLAYRLYGGRMFCVFGSVGGRSRDRRRELANAAEKYADFSVITSDDSRLEPPISICADIYSHFSDKTKAKIITERAEAIKYALEESRVGDTVMLLGRGHETEMISGGRKIHFSDSEFIRSIM